MDARSHMQNAAAIAGLGFGNSMAALAHGLGHALGVDFHIPHGRAVALFLPYTIEYALLGPEPTRYQTIARFLGLPANNEQVAGAELAQAVRKLEMSIHQPLSLSEMGIPVDAFESKLEHLVTNALTDTQTIMGTRVPEMEDIQKLFKAAFFGYPIDF